MLELIPTHLLYTGMGLPQENAAVVFSEDTIAATGPLEELRRSYPYALERPTAQVIAPPPLNAHTHLDMSSLPFNPLGYTEWVGWVIQNSSSRNLDSAMLGLKLLKRPPLSGFGDIVARAEVMRYLLSEVDRPGVAYWEVLGPNPDDAERIFNETVAKVREFRALERPGFVRLGLTPHTAHTVSGVLLQKLVGFARAENLPLQIHIAESPDEWQLFQSGTGKLAETMERVFAKSITQILGTEPNASLTPVGQLERLGILEARPTLIHAVHVTEKDVQNIARAGCPVVTCPRSNAALECGIFDWPLFARYGVEVGIGTDSIASGESLNVLDEIKFARALYGERVPLKTLVRAAVKGGSRALGLQSPIVRRGDARAGLMDWTGFLALSNE